MIRSKFRDLDRPADPQTTLGGETFEQFFRAHYEKVRRRVYSAGLDSELAQEATQESMIIAFQCWERISAMEHPVAYVTAIAINILRRVRRKKANRRAHPGPMSPDWELGPTTPGPESAVIDRIRLEHALRSIPAEQAECFVLHHMFGYPNREIALELGIPEGTVKSRVHAARGSLQGLLGGAAAGGSR